MPVSPSNRVKPADTAEGVISHVQADFADGRDSQSLPDITLKLQQRLAHNELRLEELLADTGYSNGGNYALLEEWNITAGPPGRLDTCLWPVQTPNRRLPL